MIIHQKNASQPHLTVRSIKEEAKYEIKEIEKLKIISTEEKEESYLSKTTTQEKARFIRKQIGNFKICHV